MGLKELQKEYDKQKASFDAFKRILDQTFTEAVVKEALLIDPKLDTSNKKAAATLLGPRFETLRAAMQDKMRKGFELRKKAMDDANAALQKALQAITPTS